MTKMTTKIPGGMAGAVSLLAAFSGALTAQAPTAVTTVTPDGVTLYGEQYFSGLDESAPLVLLFHQASSSGRGEYADLAPWLNEAGYRAIAWDQRSGGDLHGQANRTAAEIDSNTPAGFCDAAADLQAALDHVISSGLAEEVFIWGSSYSAGLVFRLAAENPERVSGVLAFSPASGGPMVDCRARAWVAHVTAPIVVFRPESEMALESSVEQREILTGAGADFHVLENGVHGSSMLVDSRTGHDMADARRTVRQWLDAVTR